MQHRLPSSGNYFSKDSIKQVLANCWGMLMLSLAHGTLRVKYSSASKHGLVELRFLIPLQPPVWRKQLTTLHKAVKQPIKHQVFSHQRTCTVFYHNYIHSFKCLHNKWQLCKSLCLLCWNDGVSHFMQSLFIKLCFFIAQTFYLFESFHQWPNIFQWQECSVQQPWRPWCHSPRFSSWPSATTL